MDCLPSLPRPPWWGGPWPPPGGWPPFITPPWSHSPWTWPRWAWTSPLPWQTNEGLGACDPWAGWIRLGNQMLPMGNFFNLAQFARCQAGCPQGGIPGVPGWKGTCSRFGCPWICRGCQAGWPFDADLRHIGPAAYPNPNRWDCNQVRFLGRAAPRASAQGRLLGAGAVPSQAQQQATAMQRGPAWAGQQYGPADLQGAYPRWVG